MPLVIVESPAKCSKIKGFLGQGYDVIAVEPNIETHDELKLVTLDEALTTADVIVVLVKHKQFINPVCKQKLQERKNLDFCGIEF